MTFDSAWKYDSCYALKAYVCKFVQLFLFNMSMVHKIISVKVGCI